MVWLLILVIAVSVCFLLKGRNQTHEREAIRTINAEDWHDVTEPVTTEATVEEKRQADSGGGKHIRFCEECGASVSPAAKYCAECGNKIVR